MTRTSARIVIDGLKAANAVLSDVQRRLDGADSNEASLIEPTERVGPCIGHEWAETCVHCGAPRVDNPNATCPVCGKGRIYTCPDCNPKGAAIRIAELEAELSALRTDYPPVVEELKGICELLEPLLVRRDDHGHVHAGAPDPTVLPYATKLREVLDRCPANPIDSDPEKPR